MPTLSLRSFAAPLKLDVNPLARLGPGGALELIGPAWPAEGPARLVVWSPGAEPAFALVEARIRREGAAWRAEGARTEGWVVAWWPW